MFSSAVILCQICGAKISRKVENCWGGGGGGGGRGRGVLIKVLYEEARRLILTF